MMYCLATLRSSDRTKQSVCGRQYIYIYSDVESESERERGREVNRYDINM